MIPDFLRSIWGYCPACEHWHCSSRWQADTGDPTCPHCGGRPAVIETMEDGRGRMRLDLEVATGQVGRRRFFD